MNRAASRPFRAAIILAWLTMLASIFAVASAFALERPGDFLIRNTVRLSLLYWAIAVVLILRRDCSARLAWTLACAAYLVHVATAFENAHHWSHAEAFEHVKQASSYGEGIFVSYSFTLIWTADACWWWIARPGHDSRPRWITWALHGFMVFVIVNATVIFESGAIRWVSAAALLALAMTALVSRDAKGFRSGASLSGDPLR